MASTPSFKYSRIAKESAWIAFGQFAFIAGMLVLVRVLTELLTPRALGDLALGFTIATLVNQVVMGGITNGIGRYYSVAVEQKDLSGYLAASKQLFFRATFIVLLLGAFLGFGLLTAGYSQWAGLSCAVLVCSIFSSVNSILNGVQNAARKRAVVALHSGVLAWAKIVFAIALVFLFGATSTVVAVSYAFASLFVTCSQFVFLKRLLKSNNVCRHGRSSGGWEARIWDFSWPFSVWGVFTWTHLASDRWALEVFTSTHEVGQYAILFQLGYGPIGMATGVLMTLVGPILYQRSGEANNLERNSEVHSLAWRIALISLTFTGTAFFLSFFLHERIFEILVAQPFRNISHYLPCILLAGGVFATGQMLSLKLLSDIRSGALLGVKVGTALVGIAGNVIGAWLYGIEGIVASLVLFSIVYALCVALLCARKYNPTRL